MHMPGRTVPKLPMAFLDVLRAPSGVLLTPLIFLCYLTVPLIIILLAYRLWFHPLAKFLGPCLNAISSLPAVLPMTRGRQHEYYMKLHQKYGPVVRVSPNELIFCGADAWEDIYGNKPGKRNMEKSPLHAGGLPPGMNAYSLTIAPWDVHARQRKAWAYPFSNTALLAQEPLIRKYVDKLIDRLSEFSRPSSSSDTRQDRVKHVNISAWMTYTTFDIIGELCFAEPFGCLDRGEATGWSTAVGNIAGASAWEQITRRVAGVNTFLQRALSKALMPTEMRDWRAMHFSRCHERALRRIRVARGEEKDDEEGEGKEHRGFIYYIAGDGGGASNALEKGALSELEVVMKVALFVGAGSDTTALFLSTFTNLMLKNRAVYHKLVGEIRRAFDSPDDVKFTTAKDLPYLTAVVNETFRFCPPVPTNLCRIVPEGGATIDGHWVPAGTTVSVSPWAATHSTLNWEEPYLFKPERWLGARGMDKRQASQPFSYGPRGCIGRNLAMIEQSLIICHLLLRFNVEEPVVGSPEEKDNEKWKVEGEMGGLRGMFIWEKPPLWVRLRDVSA